MMRNASSRSFTPRTAATGPKISSRPTTISGDTSSNTRRADEEAVRRDPSTVSLSAVEQRACAPSLTPLST